MASLESLSNEFWEVQLEPSEDPSVMSFSVKLRPPCWDINHMDREQLQRLADLLGIDLVEDHAGMIQNPMTGDWRWL